MPCFLEVLFESEQIPKLPSSVHLLRGRGFMDMVGLLLLPGMVTVTSIRFAFWHVVFSSNATGFYAACSGNRLGLRLVSKVLLID